MWKRELKFPILINGRTVRIREQDSAWTKKKKEVKNLYFYFEMSTFSASTRRYF